MPWLYALLLLPKLGVVGGIGVPGGWGGPDGSKIPALPAVGDPKTDWNRITGRLRP